MGINLISTIVKIFSSIGVVIPIMNCCIPTTEASTRNVISRFCILPIILQQLCEFVIFLTNTSNPNAESLLGLRARNRLQIESRFSKSLGRYIAVAGQKCIHDVSTHRQQRLDVFTPTVDNLRHAHSSTINKVNEAISLISDKLSRDPSKSPLMSRPVSLDINKAGQKKVADRQLVGKSNIPKKATSKRGTEDNDNIDNTNSTAGNHNSTNLYNITNTDSAEKEGDTGLKTTSAKINRPQPAQSSFMHETPAKDVEMSNHILSGQKQKTEIEALTDKDRKIFAYLQLLHRSLGFPNSMEKLWLPAIRKLSKISSMEKIRRLVKLVLLHSLGKMSYHRRAQSILGSVFPTGLRGFACIDTFFRRFMPREFYDRDRRTAKPPMGKLHTHSLLVNAFSRASIGVTKSREHVKQADILELISLAAMIGRKFSAYLVDNDPIYGQELYSLVRSLGASLYFAAVANPASAGIVERTIEAIKVICEKYEVDPEGAYRKSGVSPATTLQLCHAARNSAPMRVLSGFSPSNIELLEFDNLPDCINGQPAVEVAPSELISEKFRMLSYIQSLRQDYEYRLRLCKFEERLAGHRKPPSEGYPVGCNVEFKDKSNIWNFGTIQGIHGDGITYEVKTPGRSACSKINVTKLRPTWELFHDFPSRIIRVDTAAPDLPSAQKILYPDRLDVTTVYYQMMPLIKKGESVEHLLEKCRSIEDIDTEEDMRLFDEAKEMAQSQAEQTDKNPENEPSSSSNQGPIFHTWKSIEDNIREEDANSISSDSYPSEGQDAPLIKCHTCGKQRYADREAYKLSKTMPVNCGDLGVNCGLKDDTQSKRSVKPRGIKHVSVKFAQVNNFVTLNSFYHELRQYKSWTNVEKQSLLYKKLSNAIGTDYDSEGVSFQIVNNRTRVSCQNFNSASTILVIISETSVARVLPGSKKPMKMVLLIINDNADAKMGDTVCVMQTEKPKSELGTFMSLSEPWPEWAKLILTTSRKIVDVSFAFTQSMKALEHVKEAARKEFSMMYNDKVAKVVSRAEFEDWKKKYDSSAVAMRSRGIIDCKSKEGGVHWALRFAPDGGMEKPEERGITGFIRTSRGSAPTLRASQNRIIIAVAMSKGQTKIKSADISRAYPKAEEYDIKDCKWTEFPKNLQYSEDILSAIGHVPNAIIMIMRPLYGTSEAGQDFTSSLSFHFLTQAGLQNSISMPCVFVFISPLYRQPIIQPHKQLQRHTIYVSRSFIPIINKSESKAALISALETLYKEKPEGHLIAKQASTASGGKSLTLDFSAEDICKNTSLADIHYESRAIPPNEIKGSIGALVDDLIGVGEDSFWAPDGPWEIIKSKWGFGSEETAEQGFNYIGRAHRLQDGVFRISMSNKCAAVPRFVPRDAPPHIELYKDGDGKSVHAKGKNNDPDQHDETPQCHKITCEPSNDDFEQADTEILLQYILMDLFHNEKALYGHHKPELKGETVVPINSIQSGGSSSHKEQIEKGESVNKLGLYGAIGHAFGRHAKPGSSNRPRTTPLDEEPQQPIGMDLGRWERRDSNPKFLRTVLKGGPPWRAVHRRISFLREKMIFDETISPENVDNESYWHREIPKEIIIKHARTGEKLVLTTVLWYHKDLAASMGYEPASTTQSMSERDITAYRGTLMSALYVSTGRPDLHFIQFCLCKGNPTLKSYNESTKVNRLVDTIRNTGELGISFPLLKPPLLGVPLKVWAFHDAACQHTPPPGIVLPSKYKSLPVGGFLIGLVPESISPASLWQNQSSEFATIPYYIIDWGSFSISDAYSLKSYKSEIKAARAIRERARNISYNLSNSYGYPSSIVMLGDSKSMLAKIAANTGLDGSELSMVEVASLQEEFCSSMLDLVFVSDDANLADLYTKYHPETSAKMAQLRELMATGYLKIPFRSFLGRKQIQKEFKRELESRTESNINNTDGTSRDDQESAE